MFYFKIQDFYILDALDTVTGNKTMHLNHFTGDRYGEIMLLLSNWLRADSEVVKGAL